MTKRDETESLRAPSAPDPYAEIARLTKERDDLRRALEDIVAQFTDNDAAVLKQWEDAGTECLTDERWNQASSAKWYADFARTTLQALKGTE